MLTAGGDIDSRSAGASGSADTAAPDGPLLRGATKSRGAALATPLPNGMRPAAAGLGAAATIGASGSVGGGFATGPPTCGAMNLRGVAFTGCAPSKLPGPLRFRAV